MSRKSNRNLIGKNDAVTTNDTENGELTVEEAKPFEMNGYFLLPIQPFRRVMVKSYCSTQIQQHLQMFMGTILKVKLKEEKAFVYLDGGNSDWWNFEDIFVDTSIRKPLETLHAILLNPDVEEANKKSSIYMIKCLMSYYAKTNSLPEPNEIEIGEQLLLSNESFHYLRIDAMRDSMILVRSNLATFDNLWIPTCSLLIHENRRKLKENDTIGKYANRLDLKNFLTTRPNDDYHPEPIPSDFCRRQPLAPIPRAFHTLFDARKYMLSQYDEPLEVTDGAELSQNHRDPEIAEKNRTEFDLYIRAASERLRDRQNKDKIEEISEDEEMDSQNSQGSFSLAQIIDKADKIEIKYPSPVRSPPSKKPRTEKMADTSSKIALITGITGQDGSYLSELLIEKGYIVHGIVRRASNYNTQRIEHLYANRNTHQEEKMILHYGDMTDSSVLVKIISQTKPDEIYNLAAQSHVGISFDLAEYTADVDGTGTLRILDAIRTCGLENKVKFYQASTSVPQRETTPFYPRSPYAAAKVYAYWITVNYREAYNMFAINGILFNHESPRRGYGFLTRKVTRGVAKISLGLQEHLLLGNLNSTRDWGHAKDYVRGMWLMMQAESPEDFVLATGKSYSVRYFVERAFK